jgi:hypothetical protein
MIRYTGFYGSLRIVEYNGQSIFAVAGESRIEPIFAGDILEMDNTTYNIDQYITLQNAKDIPNLIQNMFSKKIVKLHISEVF